MKFENAHSLIEAALLAQKAAIFEVKNGDLKKAKKLIELSSQLLDRAKDLPTSICMNQKLA